MIESRPTSGSHLRPAADKESVLLIGQEDRLSQALGQELAALDTPVLRAATLEAAARLGDQVLHRPAHVLMVPETTVETDRFEETLLELKVRLAPSRLVPIAIGRRPDPERRRALRDAGIGLGLFGRFGRHALRFQLNRARRGAALGALRGDFRAPMEWRTQTASGGHHKKASCYSLSPTGGYFVTPRPWVVGTRIELGVPIAGRARRLAGRVLYTKDAGSHDRPLLPGGMAIGFDALDEELDRALRQDLAQCRFGLEV